MRTPLVCMFLASSLIGCAEDPSGGPLGDDPGEQGGGSMGQDEDEPCTAANDTLPYDELAANLSRFPVGDIVRAEDGTVYFVSDLAGDLQSATIGRREPCGVIEKEWLSITAPVVDLEISSDNFLYMAASGAGTAAAVTGRLYALDLSDPNAFPVNLVRQPGQVLNSLSAGPDGTLYFLQGWTDRNLRFVDANGEVSDPIALVGDELSDVFSVAAAPDGTVLVSGALYGSPRVGRATLENGSASLSLHQPPYAPRELRADVNGGYYGVREAGFFNDKTYTMIHADTVTGAQVDLAAATPVQHAIFAHGVESDTAALQLAPDLAQPVVTVTLPVPVAMNR